MFNRIKTGMLGAAVLATAVLGLGLSACGEADDACTENAYQCTGAILEQCKGGLFAKVEDCADRGADYVCHAEHGHCMMGSHSGGGGGHGAGGGHAGGSGGN